MTPEDFRWELLQLAHQVGLEPRWWLFACDGFPQEARIFIVGMNAVIKPKRRFDDIWSETGEFSKRAFLGILRRAHGDCNFRDAQGDCILGDAHCDCLSITRKNIEHVANEAGQWRTLDTNICPRPTASEQELTWEDKNNTHVIEFLLNEIKPDVVLAHGEGAIDFFRQRCPDFVDDRDFPQPVTWNGWTVQLLCSKHLSRGVGAARSTIIGGMLAAAL